MGEITACFYIKLQKSWVQYSIEFHTQVLQMGQRIIHRGFADIVLFVFVIVVLVGCGGGGSSGNIYNPKPSCGDGKLDTGEQCDDGNTTDYDGCSASCKASVWAKTFGGTESDICNSVRQTTDEGYVITGGTEYSNEFSYDVWVSKLDSLGDQEWSLVYEGDREYSDRGYSIKQIADGGFIVTGISDGDLLVLKINSSGNKTWAKTFSYIDYEYGSSIQQTTDGGYIVAGNRSDCDSCDFDTWILKLDSSGNKTWDKVFSTSINDYSSSIQQTTDGGYIVAGTVTPYSYQEGDADVWVFKIDAAGNEVWSKTFGDSADDWGKSVRQTTDGGYIVAGNTESYGAGEYDIWLLKLDSLGNEMWSKTFGGSADDSGSSVEQTADGGYIIAGYTESYGLGEKDVWVLKTDSLGSRAWEKTYGDTANDAANSIQQAKDGGFIVAGYTDCVGPEPSCDADIWVLKIDSSGNCGGCFE